MKSLNTENIKVGDIVLVDCDFANGGYEAKVVRIGNVFATIESGDYVWDIMISRLTPINSLKTVK